MILMLNVAVAVGVLLLVWTLATIRWFSSRSLAELAPGTVEIELSTHPEPNEPPEAVKLHHVAESFPLERLVLLSLLLASTTIAWYFADRNPRPYDSEWYGMYGITIAIFACYSLLLIILDLRMLQEYRGQRIFLMGAQAVLHQQQANRRGYAQGPSIPPPDRDRRANGAAAPGAASEPSLFPHEASLFTNGE